MADLQSFLSPQVTMVAIALLATFSIGGIIYALFEPQLSGRAAREKRMKSVSARSNAAVDATRRAVRDGDRRRKSVQDQLKEFEAREKKKQQRAARLSLDERIDQAGLSWSKRGFFGFSAICGLVLGLVGLLASGSLIVTLGLMFVGAFGVPRFYLGRRRKKRIAAFLNELPNAVDVIVRGTKAGLPLGECVQIVAAEAREPIKTEFRRIVEAQTMGITLAEAISKLPSRMPVAEANFLAIVVMIQAQSGGSLSEALGNLSKVLRERKAMKGKIVAMSQEAKSSAAIIGSLPFLVVGVLSLTSPSYMMLLFTEPVGNIIVVGSGIWMLTGILIMKKMIAFDF
ncbi:type II secretion system F family protein [Stappia indica]|uniref:Pilus assembly protein n=1 Tax=Stappia indica TaxID=538381 RepID=A0A857CC62_9HYPH|nr:type II secretion system F family protein [Stappia indica]QGZ36042.1 pilus assembly protein [Stappia indica]